MDRIVETYDGEKKHERGLKQMMRAGWRVENTVSSVPKLGCLGTICLGLLFRKKTRFVVTYAKGSPSRSVGGDVGSAFDNIH